MLITNPKQFLNVVYQEMKMFVSAEFAFRWQIFVWVVADALQPLILAAVWIAVAKQGGIFSVNYVITYFFLVTIISRLTKDWSVAYVSNSVLSGEFSKYLMKPFNYLAETLGISLGARVIRTIMLVPMLLITLLTIKGYFSLMLTYDRIILSLIALIMGFLINFLLGNTFALLSFFISQISGLRAFYENSAMFLSGEGIPLNAYPAWAIIFVQLLPFRYTVSFPIEIIMGSVSYQQMSDGFILAIVWLMLLVVAYKILFRMAIRKYEAYGI